MSLPDVHWRHWPGNTDRPALALHCMMASASYWGAIAARLEGGVDLRAFDMPGHGRSADWRPGGPDFHTTVTRIAAAAIDRPLDLIGHSIGATVALRIAVAAPEAVRSLTLIEPVLFAAAGGWARDINPAQGEAAAARIFLGEWGAQSYDDLPVAAQAAVRRQIWLVADTAPVLNDDTAHILRPGGLEAIDAPVMLISGQDSPPIIHDIAQNLAARLPDVGVATVPGAGHMGPITHPDQVAGLIAVNLGRG
ncbi:MAG: alpha/beta hydrolase [Paracoccus sp. (in: a-proteobacteria)]|uniref:alpha/beta fold hydrolase n=1 Tax=Paracoccus sp. TaxID=267 RepID=UPI0026DF089E|nr:alpha/beta hydrolase [Paracoccus sp. (in: a-proteobacteria)]MDO5632264.1 alpha/beta hydrolase [Paracoccus sp. (in: a-proteobacteria)]